MATTTKPFHMGLMASVYAISITQSAIAKAEVYGQQARDYTIPPEHHNNLLTAFQQKVRQIQRESDGGELGKKIIVHLQAGIDGVKAQMLEQSSAQSEQAEAPAQLPPSAAGKNRGDGQRTSA